ncbi:MAG: hypothetical protein IPO81_09485 [Kouleothrix sp.]|nr:hypothetical protein [Kouleothrix sp.]
MITGKGVDKRHNERRHRLAVQLKRYRDIKKTIPKDWPDDIQRACKRHAQTVVSLLGKRRLARAAWPWLSRPISPFEDRRLRLDRHGRVLPKHSHDPAVRVPRGRPSNPTALP